MKRASQFLGLALLLATASLSHGAFRFTAWSDNHVTYATYLARFQHVASEMERILGGASAPAFHISGGDCENGGSNMFCLDGFSAYGGCDMGDEPN